MFGRRKFTLIATTLAFGKSIAGGTMTWPNDVDGDVFRQLQRSGFNFGKTYVVDFNVDFVNWPPPHEAVEVLRKKYKELELRPPEDGDIGHIAFQLKGKLSYEWVVRVQREATALVARHGGKCETWGVLGP